MTTRFVAQPIRPALTSVDTAALARGEPGLPRVFHWNGQDHHITEVLATWKDTGPCHSGSDERYVRRHWYQVRTEEGLEMRLYCLRHSAARKGARGRAPARPRWWLYSLDGPTPDDE